MEERRSLEWVMVRVAASREERVEVAVWRWRASGGGLGWRERASAAVLALPGTWRMVKLYSERRSR